ncbi:hypothetical protein PTNB73_01865 [Pyrenophora teres f. teres]|nr:hypothetical protein HRS9139_00451 [Pyrenophora teres f. teres]KAE8848022.1 hypothetical protein PTNB85_01865 [Pyrenophora teres f. teres]KAE8853816.1 hypothetical protein HRS9122_00808 [Pyrenophora teres f. teres]KAE8872714.1 hypothetical protein PTNB73_01865 [Pyrenophora teres f. teres]
MAGTSMDVSTSHAQSGPSTKDNRAARLHIKDELDGDDYDDMFADLESEVYDPHVYKPRPELPSSHVHMQTLKRLIVELENGRIDVDPEYQREVVWTAERMTGLINSLMENYYIPPIILNSQSNAANGNRKDIHVCVDGKQRLSSVRAFVKGMIPCHDYRGEKWWFCDSPDVRRKKVLDEKAKQLFLEKEFIIFQFKDLSSEQEEDLFARVQMGVQLSAAEKMRAKSGPWQELTKLFVQDFDLIYSLLKDRQRAKDFQLTLACFSQILEVQHPSTANGMPAFRANHSPITKLLNDTRAIDDATKSHLADVWKIFQDLIELDPNTFMNADKYLSGVQTFAPMEMVAVTTLISEYSKTRNNELLLGDIRALRVALREHFKEMRINATMWKFIWDFIADLEAIRGAVNGSTVDRITQQPLNPTATSAPVMVPRQPVVAQQTFQRKRPLPKSKQIPIFPPVIKTDCEPQLPTPPLPSRKRQRTDHVQADGDLPVSHPSRTDSLTAPHFADLSNGFQESAYRAAASSSPRVITRISPQCAAQRQLPINSNPASPMIPNPAMLPQPAGALGQSQPRGPTYTTLIASWGAPGSIPQATQMSTSVHAPADKARRKSPYQSPYAPYTPESTPRLTPPFVQPAQAPEVNSYRAPTAPMQISTRVVSAPGYISSSNGGFSEAMSASGPTLANQFCSQSRPSSKAPVSLQGFGAFAPKNTDKEWNGVIASVSPKMPSRALPPKPAVAPTMASHALPQKPAVAPSAAPPVAARTLPQKPVVAPSVTSPVAEPSVTPPAPIRFKSRKRKNSTLPVTKPPTPAQLDNVIDLTSDGEQEEERQSLLQAFKNKPAAVKQSKVPAPRIKPNPNIIAYPDSDEELEPANNPYAKFKQNPRAGVGGPS